MANESIEDIHLDGCLALAAAMIQDAVRVYHNNQYACNVTTDMVSPRMEALTFFHGPLFENLVQLGFGADPSYVRYTNRIPDPAPDCACEWCRTDYRAEAMVVSDNYRKYRFHPGGRHHVYWRRGKIMNIFPHNAAYDNTLNASQYLKQLEKPQKENR